MDPNRHLRSVPAEPAHASAQRLEDLLLQAGRGSAPAFEALYTTMLGQVYRVALRIVRDPSMAEDVAQEAMVEAWRKAAQFDPARGTAKAWILTIAHRRAVDRVRREQRQREQMEAEAAVAERDETPAPQEAVVEDDYRAFQSRRVRGALESLTDKQREALELAYYGGRTHTEVAHDLGVPLGTAKTRIRDALTKLRDSLEEV